MRERGGRQTNERGEASAEQGLHAAINLLDSELLQGAAVVDRKALTQTESSRPVDGEIPGKSLKGNEIKTGKPVQQKKRQQYAGARPQDPVIQPPCLFH